MAPLSMDMPPVIAYSTADMPLSFRHLTSTAQITREDADVLLSVAADMEKVVASGESDLLKGRILAALFYEPSTRTRLSFEAAMLRLGGQVITADGFQFSSLYKGESIEDTMMMVGGYADIIAMRHPEAGSADKAITTSPVPFINAGDGTNQHPTQALLDLYTIQKECGKIKGVHVAMVGDLKNGRTVHSLTTLLTLFPGVTFTFVAPDQLKMPEKITAELVKKGMLYVESSDLQHAIDADVLYMTRIQKERFATQEEYDELKDSFILKAEHLAGKKTVILHPLPRVNEIATDVDVLENAAYFRQAQNGVPVRMALLALMLGKA